MMTKLTMLLATVAICLAGPAAASSCAARALVVDRLTNDFGETRQSMGLGAQGAVIEVFASEETGTWTITVTTAAGLTCMVASGQAYEALAEALPAAGDDA